MNPLVGLYRFPRGMDMTEYREHFEVFNPDLLCRKVVQNLRPVGTYQIQSRFSGSYPLTIGAIYEYVGNIDIL